MNVFTTKTINVDYTVHLTKKLPNKPPYGKKYWAYRHTVKVQYVGFGLYTKLFEMESYRAKKGDKLWIEIHHVEILRQRTHTYNYDPYKQQNLDPHILDRDDRIFDLVS